MIPLPVSEERASQSNHQARSSLSLSSHPVQGEQTGGGMIPLPPWQGRALEYNLGILFYYSRKRALVTPRVLAALRRDKQVVG